MICLSDCLFLTLTFCKWCAVAETETETDYSETETEAESDISEPEIQLNSAYSKNWTPLKTERASSASSASTI